MSWEADGSRHELTGNCLDLSEGGASIEVNEPVPLATRLHIRFPDLQAEAEGVVRRASDDSIGIEFADLVYYGHHRLVRKVTPRRDPEKYVMAVVGLVLILTVAYSIPGLLPDWASFSMRPTLQVKQAPGSFTLGSTKPEVYALQGAPNRMTQSTWYYGSSRVHFRGNFVAGWSDSPDHPLRTSLARPGDPAEDQDGFTTGSTAAEVLATQGPPIELTDEVWRYESTEVYFKEGKVAGWKSTVQHPLKTTASDAEQRTQTSAKTKESPVMLQPEP